MSTGHVFLTITGSVGTICSVESVTNLAPSNAWLTVTSFVASGGENRWSYPVSPESGSRFFRVASSRGPAVPTNLVFIPAGTFTMGSPASEAERDPGEAPTVVSISRDFWMGRCEATQGEYLQIMSNSPSWFHGARPCCPEGNFGTNYDRPVEQVSWSNAVAYCAALTQRERQAGRLPPAYAYRLPTEAEWEYACRAGTTNAFHYGAALRSGMANFYGFTEYDSSTGSVPNPNGVFPGKPVAVGSYLPNAWGLYDMHGSVWEWCLDWWSASLPGGSVTDPKGPATGTLHVSRGGSWYVPGKYLRSACRLTEHPRAVSYETGFRVVLAPE